VASGFDTAANVINDAALELGLIASAIADPLASTNQNIVQLRSLLKTLGHNLTRERQWSHLQKEKTITTVSGQSLYPLPSDFGRHIDQSQWDRTSQWPLGGPLSPQGHQLLKAQSSSGVVYKLFRTQQDKLLVYPTPTSAVTLAFEYISRWWVKAATAAKASLDLSPNTATPLDTVLEATTTGVAGNEITVTLSYLPAIFSNVLIAVSGDDVVVTFKSGATIADLESAVSALAGSDDIVGVRTAGTAGTALAQADVFAATYLAGGRGVSTSPSADSINNKGDVLWFDRPLLVAGLKLAFRKAKGLDTSAELDDYSSALDKASGQDGAAPVLSLNGSGPAVRLLDERNIPETGFGS
jgi:hypothetical protein